MAGLDRVLEEDELGKAHSHLIGACHWYKNVSEERNCTDPAEHCKHNSDGQGKVSVPDPQSAPGLIVKFTPRTPEASTVVKPTVPPGGPGLFHVKGMHLPPYMEHLWFHLVARYGKHDAYRVANGIVHKWAQGINPGGHRKDGKVSHVHSDVRAAAQRNVAEWEADKARAHSGGGHVKATAPMQYEGQISFPGMDKLPLPATPGDKIAREMLVAHRIDDTVRAVGHGEERISAALSAATPELRRYNSIHVANHLAVALDNMHFLVDDFKRHYPAEAAELEALRQCVGLTKALNKATRVATTAHLTETTLHELTHAKRHADQMLKPEPKDVWDFNADHARSHLKGAQEHIDKLSEHVMDNYPGEAKYLDILKRLQDGHLVTDEPAWKELKLAGALNVGSTTSKAQQGYQAASAVAGKYSRYGLHQHPSQTVSPSPPLPPAVPRPTPKEVRALIAMVPDCSDASLSSQTRTFLETAAVKLEKDDDQAALASLRSAQAALYSGHKADLRPYHAATYNSPGALSTTDARVAVPPAAVASAKNEMFQGREQQLAWRALSFKVAELIERLRKRYFHGHINGVLPNMRLTEESTMTALDKVVALAGAPITTGKDVSFPTTSDTTQETRLLQPKDDLALDAEAQKELASLPPLSRIAIEAHLNSARDAHRRGDRRAASIALARACALARGESYLAECLHKHKHAIAAEGNMTHSAADDEYRPLHQNSPQTVADTGNAKLTARLR